MLTKASIIVLLFGFILLSLFLVFVRKEAKKIAETPLSKKEQRRMKKNGF